MPINNVVVTLTCGRITREVTPEALAGEIGVETVRPALLALLLRPSQPDIVPAAGPTTPGEPTEGAVRSIDGTKRSIEGSQEMNIVRSDRSNDGTQENILSEIDRSNDASELNIVAENRSVPGTPMVSVNSVTLAQRLAQELGDPGGLSWYRTLVATLDVETIMNTLSRTLRVPAAKIRTTRGAYFTSLVSPLYREAREQKSPLPV